MRAYSQDLRERILRAVESGSSRAEAARRFSVGERTVRRYLRRQATTGSRAPVAYWRGPAISPAQGGALLERQYDLTAACLHEDVDGRLIAAAS